jgi:uncharacterized NAD-dependent epimerase/dehydratase family protein
MNNPTPDTRAARRLALLQHGGLRGLHGKTGLSLLRYCEEKVTVVIDRECAGQSLRDITRLPLTRDIPIVGSMTEALAHAPDAVAIGIAALGGKIQESWLVELREAVCAGVSVWNGMHTPLARDPVIAAALRPGVYVWDMRQEPPDIANGRARARELACKRVLFVGTDMGIGKMTAALEFDRAARDRGLRSKFIATGQAGMMIAGDGVCLDAVRVDFASGAIEAQVMAHGPTHDCLWVEGQGSILNPASTATLPLIRGTQPTHLVLVHRAGMRHLKDFPDVPVPALAAVVSLYEMVASAAGAFARVPVAGIAMNTWGLDDAQARAEIDATATLTGLPCTDAVRYGVDSILDVILPRENPKE